MIPILFSLIFSAIISLIWVNLISDYKNNIDED